MDKLIKFWERCYKLAKMSDNASGWNSFRHQAYGAAILFIEMEPDSAVLVEELWDKNWHPAFIQGAMASTDVE